MMKSHALLAVAAISFAGQVELTAQPAPIVLQNEHLTATFAAGNAGPRLTEVAVKDGGGVFRFEDAEAASLYIVPTEIIHDPKLAVAFADQKDLRFQGVDVQDDATRMTLTFQHELARIEVTYGLDSDVPVLRKEVTTEANDVPAYVAGVRHWRFKAGNATPIWPESGRFGQPVILESEHGGCLFTLEWPRAEFTSEDDRLTLSYRPGYALASGASKQVAAGSMLFFPRQPYENLLQTARHTFFAHVADRVQPHIPCPIKFTTWGPWMGETRADRMLEVIDDLAYVGTDLLHFDAGWQWPDRPYSTRMAKLRDADDATWDEAATLPERAPDGLLPLVEAAKANGMELSLWFDAAGHVFMRETEDWASRDPQGNPVYRGMWVRRWPKAPVQSLASEYGEQLRAFMLEALERYDLGGVMFDNNHWIPQTIDHGRDHALLANGWNSSDVQFRKLFEIFAECYQRKPGIYRFLCNHASWPWAMLYATHIHAGDPGTSGQMREAVRTDYPARAMAYERRLAWKRHYDNFVPPWGVKGDIAGWSLQQHSPIPINLAHTGELIPCGEGWVQNMFTCFATTAVRDIRFSFEQMPAYDRDILKEWLAWDRKRTHFIHNCRSLFEISKDPNEGVMGFSHVGEGRGVIYLFNASFDSATANVHLNEAAGFQPDDENLEAYIVYPLKAQLPRKSLAYGDRFALPIAGKECLVIEVGLDRPEGVQPYTAYTRAVERVVCSFDTLFMTPPGSLIDAVQQGAVRLEIGDSHRDRRVAAQIVEVFGAAIGRRIELDAWMNTSPEDARCRLIIGTHEGLKHHPEAGDLFVETLYNRFLTIDGRLFSAPAVFTLKNTDTPTYCLVAPRPEQLARLAINLTSEVLGSPTLEDESAKPQWSEATLKTTIPDSTTATLRFRPLMHLRGAFVMPNDLSRVRYEITAIAEGGEKRLWKEEIPPFATRAGPGGWWKDRAISVADFAGKEVTIKFNAGHVDGRTEDPQALGGFDRIAVQP